MESLYSSSHGNVQRGDRAWERAIAVSRELGPSRHQAAGLFGFSLVSTSGFDRCRTLSPCHMLEDFDNGPTTERKRSATEVTGSV